MCVLKMIVWSPASFFDQLPRLDDLLGVETGRGLVENQHVGVVYERLGEADALPVASRQLRALPVGHVGDARAIHHALDALAPFARRHALDLRHERQVFSNRHVGVQWRRLRQIAGATFGFDRLVEDVEAGHDGLAFGGRHVARQDAHGRRLSGAVRPQEAEDLAALDAEADVFYCRHGAVPLGQMLNFNHARLLSGLPSGGQPKMLTDADENV
jgi:hypothetical protein